jgi:hypothetical protein
MRSLTHVVLPIALVVGAIFGITFITSYTSPPKQDDKPSMPKDGRSSEPPLRFFTLEGKPGTPFDLSKMLKMPSGPDAEGRSTGFGEMADLYRRAMYQPDIEIGETGHHDFWFQNSHPQEVRITLNGKSCQCAGARLGIIPPAAWQDYLDRAAAIGGLPALPSSAPFLAAAAADLQQQITWHDLVERAPDNERPVIAAANERTGAQLGIVRVTWEGKAEGPKTITAEVYAHLPNAAGSIDRLDVQTNVVPSVRLWPPGAADMQFGDLLAHTSSAREVIFWSSTRRALDLSLSLGKSENEPCLVWTEPQPLSDAELTELSRELSKQANFALRARCAYKVRVTLHERREIEHDGMKEVRQMDVGPMTKVLVVSAGTKNAINIPLRATIRGEVRIIGGPEDQDRIDFGRPFQSSQERIKEVRVVSERPDLDLELAPNATTPSYLEATLTPRMAGGRREWTLRVRVPPEKLFGALPPDSAIVLQAKDASKRRIRIPVVGKTFDSGSPF